jgi:class 3 adenylate cyclase
MEQKDCAVLFVDISGSTRFFDVHGEVEGRAMVERFYGLAVPEVERCSGRVVKNLGDGFLAVFPSPSDLMAAAMSVHAVVAEHSEDIGKGIPIRVHSGGHFGPAVVADDGDVFGDVVNVAARIQGVAGPDEIYVSDEIVAGLSKGERMSVRRVGRFPLRGKAEEMTLHEVVLTPSEATMLFSSEAVRQESRVRLTYNDQSVEMTPQQSKFTIGRIPGNDLQVDDRSVSREHCELIRRKGRVYLVDRSTNGTHLYPASGVPRHVHREELMIEGSGHFALGRPDGPRIDFEMS